jgi:dipeptidyl aminopeptidase/acylaminoacyl peptidase
MRLPIVTVLAVSAGLNLWAGETYQKPPKQILDVLHAPPPPIAVVNPTRTHILFGDYERYPGIAEVSAPMLRLAGARIDPATNGPHVRAARIKALSLLKIDGGNQSKIAVPVNAVLSTPIWSPDGTRFAITNTTAAGIDLYLGSVGSPALRRVPLVRINDTLGSSVQWLSGSNRLLVKIVPALRGKPPVRPAVPAGPNVQEGSGASGPVRTYEDLLKDPYDEALFDYYFTAQLVSIDYATLQATPIGKPVIFAAVSPAPDGKHLLVTTLRKPYSYLHPYSVFPREIEVWSTAGTVVQKVASKPLADNVPIEGVETGPRNITWRPTEPSTLMWSEALDGGDPRKKVPNRDHFMMLRIPATSPPVEVFKVEQRASGLQFGEGGMAMIGDYDRDKRWVRVFRVFLDDLSSEPRLLYSRNVNDRYGDIGSPATRVLPNGRSTIRQSGDYIFLQGTGATPEGDRPFLDRFNLNTWQSERLWRADAKGYESVVAILSDDGSRFLTSRESPDEPPNFFVRTSGSDQTVRLTNFTDPAPILRKIKKQLVKYNRSDGTQCSFTLYLPPDYKEGVRYPTIVYAYPMEYTDPGVAGQIGGSTQRFTTLQGASHLFLLLAGYVILNDTTIPIVGDPETVNNTYVEQLTMSAKAAIDKAVELGVTDRTRVGVTGHSYGGFMTANLLAHTDLFRTGVARSGAYNRTLTPFGFQSERRTFWEAPEIYMKMSPFAYANKINEPILLIHGEADDNTGTFPIQSERLYQAIRGNGGTVRLVMLPSEPHGYSAKETIQHVLYETLTWFDKYLKN